MTLVMYAIKVIRRVSDNDLVKVNQIIADEIARRQKTQNNTRGVTNGKGS